MGKGKWVSILIAPHNRAGSWNLRVPGWTLWAALAVFCLGLAGLGVSGLLYQRWRAKADQVERLQAEVAKLVEANRAIAVLEKEIVSLTEFNRRVREWVGLPPDTSLLHLGQGPYPAGVGGGSPLVVGSRPLSGSWGWPAKGWISRGFGPGSDKEGGHFGIDIVAARDEPVVAARAGRAILCGWDDRFGNLIVIDHGGGWVSYYGHNSEVFVSEGDSVSKGQRIGTIGSTGVSSAPHLHFEVRKDGEALDPMGVLEGEQPAPAEE